MFLLYVCVVFWLLVVAGDGQCSQLGFLVAFFPGFLVAFFPGFLVALGLGPRDEILCCCVLSNVSDMGLCGLGLVCLAIDLWCECLGFGEGGDQVIDRLIFGMGSLLNVYVYMRVPVFVCVCVCVC